MHVGTKSILFGVHQFFWHPISVLLAWIWLYREFPRWSELVAIFCHDLGYWGKPDLDGEAGRSHPYFGALLSARIVVLLKKFRWLKHPPEPWEWGGITYYLALGHSRELSKQLKINPSKLYAADKASIFFDPKPWYLLRARLSGEIHEFKKNAIESGGLPADATDGDWYEYYRNNVRQRPEIKLYRP